MTPEHQPAAQFPSLDSFSPDVRCHALRLLANGGTAEYRARAAAFVIEHHFAELSEILQYLAMFGHMRQMHGDDIGDELQIAEAAQLLERVEKEVSQWE